MYSYNEIYDEQFKSEITERILRELPEWFGIEDSIVDYTKKVKDKVFYVAYSDNEIIGFLCISYNNQFTAEIYVTGILKPYHRRGIGKALLALAERDLINKKYKFLMVKTLGATADYEFYERTRKFYVNCGFYPLQEFSEIWGTENPCLIMVKNLAWLYVE